MWFFIVLEIPVIHESLFFLVGYRRVWCAWFLLFLTFRSLSRQHVVRFNHRLLNFFLHTPKEKEKKRKKVCPEMKSSENDSRRLLN